MADWSKEIDAVANRLAAPPVLAAPARPALAMKLGGEMGVPAPVIGLNVDIWKQAQRRKQYSEMVRSSSELQSYVMKNPMYGQISLDDMKKLRYAADVATVVGLALFGPKRAK